MLLHGKKLEGPSVEVLVLPRQDKDIVFRAQAVLDYDDFDKVYPRPTPPEIIRRGGERGLDIDDKDYQDKIQLWAENRTHWMILKSLTVTDGLEWEKVDLSKPDTWANYSDELKEAGFSVAEVGRIVQLVTSVNGLDQDKIDEATKRFLAGQGAPQESAASPDSAPNTTPSGELVKDSG